VRINELQSIISFLAQPHIQQLQSEALDLLLTLIEPKLHQPTSDQLILLLYEPNVADHLYALVAQPDLNPKTQQKILKIIRLLLSTNKVYDKSKARLRLEDTGGYGGLVSKLQSQQGQHVSNNSQLALDLIDNFLLDNTTAMTNYDGLWHIVSLFTLATSPRLADDQPTLITARIKCLERLINFVFVNSNVVKILVKSLAWQDVVCQLFCLSEISKSNVKQQYQQPEIVISSDTFCEEANGSPVTGVDLHSTYMISGSLVLSKGLIENRRTSEEIIMLSPVKETTATRLNVNESDSLQTLDETVEADTVASGEEMFEKLVYFVFKLAWEGVIGSHQDAWKVIR